MKLHLNGAIPNCKEIDLHLQTIVVLWVAMKHDRSVVN